MRYFTIPLINTDASISLNVTLNNQKCLINIYQKSTGLYFDLYLNGNLIVGTRLCLNQTPLVIASYLAFVGNLFFVDTQGNSDPTYDGLGKRYILVYSDV